MTHSQFSKRARVSTPCSAPMRTFEGRCLNCGYDPQPIKPRSRIMRLFVLSSGYVAAFTNSLDEAYWGSSVIPLGFGAEVSPQRAIDIMQSANPNNLVRFAGGYNEYKNYISR